MPRKYSNGLLLDSQVTVRKGTIDLTGRKFGKLLVIKLAGRHNTSLYWHCACDCGQFCIKRGSNLTANNKTRSCGCLSGAPTLGGLSQAHKSEYNAWKDMISRCSDSKNKSYHRYGGRGIKVCGQWAASFETFLRDIGQRPSARYSLDRWPDKNGNYEPENCRWATRKQQQRNMRSNRLITIDGQSKPMAEWAEVAGTPYAVVFNRLKYGWEAKDAVFFSLNHQSYKLRKQRLIEA